jgi:hypothetical protein
VAGEVRTHAGRGHIPVLCQLSYGHRRPRWESNPRLAGVANPCLTARPHGPDKCMRRDGFEPPWSTRDARVTAWCNQPLCHLRESPTVSVEGFEPSTPCARGTCAARLRHTLSPTHPRVDSNHHRAINSRARYRYATWVHAVTDLRGGDLQLGDGWTRTNNLRLMRPPLCL